jgi:hypothetical protein
MRSISNFKELKLYHQIHPIKLGTDIASAIAFLFLLWRHRIAPALVAGFLPPIIVSGVMMIWPPNVENVKNSPLGKYVSKYMTPTIEVVRLLTLAPMAWGAWIHHIWLILLGFVVLLFAWCNGLFWPHRTVRGGVHGQL